MIRSTLERAARRLRSRAEPTPEPTPAPLPTVDEDPAPPTIEVDGDELSRWIASGVPFELLDIRELPEMQHGHARGASLIPMNQVPRRLGELPPRDRKLIVYCAAGVRSYGVTEYLREHGWEDAWSLIGGLSAYVGAGGEHERPPTASRFRPGARVRADGATGTIQRVIAEYGQHRYTVRVQRGETFETLVGLVDSDLADP